ncbi:MAG: D-aminoacylase [Acidobacteria bacterium]|nr:D-aminoacylase [Acidobacteriota bacterium]
MILRRELWLAVMVVCLSTVAGLHAQSSRSETYDLLIRGGRIVDGTGNPWFRGDVAITAGRIAAVGRLAGAQASQVAAQVIDARGLIVAPGFIDLHTHSDLPLLADGDAQSKVRQGVTLDVLGESTTVAPRDGLPPTEDRSGVRVDWTTFTDYFERLRRKTISMNVISYVSLQQIRRVVLGYDLRAASPAELERMKQLAARSMEEGAWGLVTRFESGGPAHPEEAIALAKVAASYGGIYASHIGSEGFEQEKEIAFAVRVAEEVQIPVHLFHLKVRARENWGTMSSFIAQIEAARAQGLEITANQYPYTAMFHNWSSFFPLWMRQGGPDKFAERLQDPSLREKIKNDPEFIAWAKEHGWWEGITMALASTRENAKYEGMSLAEIARLRGDADPADTSITLMAEEGGRIRGVFHAMSEEDVRLVMKQPWVAHASDGSAINLEAPGVPHPRNYNTNSRVLGHYVRDEKVLTIEEAVRKMTSLPAQILGLRDRGQLREGFAADVVVFDPVKVRGTNSFDKPKSYPEGISYVLVNGVLVIDKGQHTKARPGKVIYGRGYKPRL